MRTFRSKTISFLKESSSFWLYFRGFRTGLNCLIFVLWGVVCGKFDKGFSNKTLFHFLENSFLGVRVIHLGPYRIDQETNKSFQVFWAVLQSFSFLSTIPSWLLGCNLIRKLLAFFFWQGEIIAQLIHSALYLELGLHFIISDVVEFATPPQSCLCKETLRVCRVFDWVCRLVDSLGEWLVRHIQVIFCLLRNNSTDYVS